MTGTGVTTLDLRSVEAILQMSGGYVLDFSNRTFAEFFAEFGVDIDDEQYFAQGSSKANRLRTFLRTTSPPLTGRILAGLLQHRLASQAAKPPERDLTSYRRLVERLGGTVSDGIPANLNDDAGAEAAILTRVFQPELFNRLPVDEPMREALVARMHEAQRCIGANANLAAVILCGSVLEGMCLGYGARNAERVNRAFADRYKRPAKPLPEWRLSEWIDVLAQLGDLSPNVEKFGHGLRDFRNYVHPAEQLAHRFPPDAHTARIGFQVVVAAAEDLVAASGRGKGSARRAAEPQSASSS